jgi:hypothetical protein
MRASEPTTSRSRRASLTWPIRRGDDANEFQGYHHDASVSFIVTSVFSPSNLELVDFLVSTDTTGAFVSNGWDFCLRDTDTSVEVTVTNSTGGSVAAESFELGCGT